ncbi:MAG: xerC 6, partial [Nocardioides sp.]|nr:xerC 6 [Nocardioides sp.]
MTPGDLDALVPSWTIHLRSERKTDGTIATYLKGVRPYLAWCTQKDMPPLERGSLKLWTTELLDAGLTASTVRTRMMPV